MRICPLNNHDSHSFAEGQFHVDCSHLVLNVCHADSECIGSRTIHFLSLCVFLPIPDQTLEFFGREKMLWLHMDNLKFRFRLFGIRGQFHSILRTMNILDASPGALNRCKSTITAVVTVSGYEELLLNGFQCGVRR